MAINEDQQHDFESEIEKENTISTENEPKGPPQACLFVASLSSETKEETLAECFGEFGTVLKIKFLKDRSARPYAFVQYLDVEDAETALEHTNGMVLDNRRLRVERAKVNRTLFLAKLPRDMSNNQLREVVEEFGPVESVTIIKNHQTNKSKGCGFVKFVYREDAIEAFIGLKNKNRKWVIEWATSTNDPDLLGVDKYNIFVGGLNPRKIDKELLEQRFGFYGEIESITLINRSGNSGYPQGGNGDENSGTAPFSPTNSDSDIAGAESTKSSSGTNSSEETDEIDSEFEQETSERSAFAFVRYKDPAHSASAIENENGTEWLDRRIRVQYCESQEMKNKRRASKFFQMNNGFNSPFYPQGMQLPPPMLMLGGHIPLPYNMAPPLASKFNPYGPQVKPDGVVDPQNNLYNSFVSPYPMFAYNSAPWLYGMPQVPPMENPLSPERQLSPDELMNGANGLGGEIPLPDQSYGSLDDQIPVHASLYHMPMNLGSDLSHMVHGGPVPPW